MEEQGLTKTDMTNRINTSRAALNILLDSDNTPVTLNMTERAAKAVGKRLQLNLVAENNK